MASNLLRRGKGKHSMRASRHLASPGSERRCPTGAAAPCFSGPLLHRPYPEFIWTERTRDPPVQHEPARWLVLPCQHGQGLKLMRSAPACVTIQSACDGGALWVPEILAG